MEGIIKQGQIIFFVVNLYQLLEVDGSEGV